MDWLIWVLGQGATVTLVVQALKRLPFVQRVPKVVAAALNLAAALVAAYGLGTVPAGPVAAFLTAVAAQVASVGTYETIVRPLTR